MKQVLFVVFCLSGFFCFSQVGPGVWQDHLSNDHCNSVTKFGSKIYSSYQNGLIRFDEKDKEIETLNKINGLNDVGIRLLRANSYNNKLLVIYNNCNIDVIDASENIKNYSDFKLKSLSGKKIVNEVTFHNQLAYLACGFGIVVFDTEKHEIKDTYFIGPNATNLEVYQVALNDSLIFAATPNGMYQSNYKTKALNNFNNWKLDTLTLPKGVYSGVVNVNGTILSAFSQAKRDNTIKNQDTLYTHNGSSGWQRYGSVEANGNVILRLYSFGGMFAYVNEYSILIKNISDDGLVEHINSFNGAVNYGTINDVYIGKDFSQNISYWQADQLNGLFQTYGKHPYFPQNKIKRSGTKSNSTSNIDVFEGTVAVSPSFISITGGFNGVRDGINIYKNNEWSYLPTLDSDGIPLLDVTSVLIDRKDPTKLWVCSWFYGVLEFKNNKLISIKNSTVTPNFPSIYPPENRGEPRCSGLSMDKDGNVWFTHSDQPNFLGVIKKGGVYQNYNFGAARFSRITFVDKNNYVWILHEREGGITVLNHNNFGTPETKYLTKDIGNGNLESNSVFSIAQDKDGKIWVGTAAGIKVFYNPTNIFTKNADIDAQPIKIVQDGNVELLLGKEIVTSIVIDGANNKWVGTAQSGVYCFNPDGQKQIHHFTAENSPLYSNSIIDINYDEVSGDIFIGTEIGIQSYRSTIVEGSEDLSQVIAYPNPVRPNYQGTVLVKGLIDNSVVKITDIYGNMVWETKSTGGQIEWPITTLAGKRVVSGVYTVYCSTTDGELSTMTKILVVN